MNQFLPFILNHWVLWAALIVVIILILLEETKRNVGGMLKASPQAVINLINHDEAKVIDVRPKEEFGQGHLLTATNIPHDNFANQLAALNAFKTKPIILVAGSGQMTAIGAQLKKNGFEKIYLLDGGIAAWQKADLPLVKK